MYRTKKRVGVIIKRARVAQKMSRDGGDNLVDLIKSNN